MIYNYVNGEWREVERISSENKEMSAVYVGDKLVWEAGRCCFSKGLWLNEQPWKNELGWKDNV